MPEFLKQQLKELERLQAQSNAFDTSKAGWYDAWIATSQEIDRLCREIAFQTLGYYSNRLED